MSSPSTIYIAPVTPLSESGEIQLAAIAPLCRLLKSRGAQGFYVCGGTGEGMLLTVRDRMRLAEAWRAAAGPTTPVLVHVGAVSLADATELARHAAGIGAAAISAMGPTVFSPRDAGDLVRHFAKLTAAAPRTPFYYYLNSGMAGGLKVSGFDFLTAARDALPTLAGIKFTHEDLMDLARCLRFADGRYRIFYGRDELMLGACATGATDFIGGAFNVVSPLARQVVDAFDAGNLDDARLAYGKLIDVVAVLRRFGGLPAVKATMELLGVPCGPLQSPLRTIVDSEKTALFAALTQAWPAIADVETEPDDARFAVAMA